MTDRTTHEPQSWAAAGWPGRTEKATSGLHRLAEAVVTFAVLAAFVAGLLYAPALAVLVAGR